MNSIELASNPEKEFNPAVKDTPASLAVPDKTKAAAGQEATLRVFVKDGDGYMLQHETTDFHRAVRLAERLYEQGKDILVNERDNPLIVHAKSNQRNGVDVGREIAPSEKGNVYQKGPGEIILPSFYAKLPMDTKAFDEREPVRVFAKEGSAYVLQSETKDFHVAMMDAQKLYDNGKDILVNDRNNPHHVHARSNIHQDANVGNTVDRDMRDGVFQKGDAEVVSPSFYDKLPMDTKAFDEREKAGRETRRIDTPQSKSLFTPERPDFPKDPTANKPRAEDPAKDIGPVPGMAGQTVKAVAKEVEADIKAILKKTGYELPEAIRGAYAVDNGKFKDKVSDALRFEDHGKKLSTPVEDRVVIADMVTVAAAKNWNNLDLKGTENFKQQAWLEAESRGIHTKGYQPNERDLEQLTKLTQERGIAGKQPGEPSKVENRQNTIKVDIGRASKDAPEQKKPAKERASAPQPAKDGAESRGITGRLLDHGAANYNHDPEEKKSYFVKLATENGERTIWGKDLERALAKGDVKKGDEVTLELQGSKPVTVDALKRNDDGKVVGSQEIDTHKNKWEVKPATLAVTRPLSAGEQMNVNVAAKILDERLAKFPENIRKDVLAAVATAIDKGDLKLPTPMVAERAVDKPQPTPAVGTNRSR